MEAAEALELMAGEMAQIDATFQFWLASTFAMIVAVHALSEGLDAKIRAILTVLYGLLSAYSVVKTLGDFEQLAYLGTFAVGAGIELPNSISGLAGLLRFAIYGLGSLAALTFVWAKHVRKAAEQDDPADARSRLDPHTLPPPHWEKRW